MKTPPRLATMLLERFGPKNDALAGDLRERYMAGKSRRWYWGQVITAIGISATTPGLRRAIWLSSAVTTVIVVVLELPFLAGRVAVAGWSTGLLMTLYLIPQALPIAVPVGVTIGTLCGARKGAARPRISWLLIIAVILCSGVSFATVAWVVPASNQAFRVTLAGRHVLRGAPELTLSELRPLVAEDAIPTMQLVGADDQWQIAVNYYGRLALACAPIVFAMFAMFAAALAGRKRVALVVGVGCGYVAYFLIEPEFLKSLPPLAVAWLPNVALASVSLIAHQLSGGAPHHWPDGDAQDRMRDP